MAVRCPSCGSDNPDGKKFCADCGTVLTNRCAQCGAESQAGKKFCGECGAPIAKTRLSTDFRDAIGLARTTHAKAWELRATTRLARLLAHQGHRAAARALRAEIYGWFTEGFDTRDLIDAKALLEELSE